VTDCGITADYYCDIHREVCVLAYIGLLYGIVATYKRHQMMLERQRRINFLAEMPLQATMCDIYKLHTRLPVVSLIFCLFSKYFPSEIAIPILLVIQYISHSLGGRH